MSKFPVLRKLTHMSAQIPSLAERFFAFCALLWFLSTMGEDVSDCVIVEYLHLLHLFGFSPVCVLV